MATEKEVIDALKDLNPKSVSVDSEGRIIIKDEAAKKRLEQLQGENHKRGGNNYINCDC